MYALDFHLDTATLQATYGSTSWNNAYTDIKNVLVGLGFTWQQGSVYFGGDKVNAVTCFTAASQLTQRFPWFASTVRDMRMLKIEDVNDLQPVIEQSLSLMQNGN
jgi:virulence-associated protein VapD